MQAYLKTLPCMHGCRRRRRTVAVFSRVKDDGFSLITRLVLETHVSHSIERRVLQAFVIPVAQERLFPCLPPQSSMASACYIHPSVLPYRPDSDISPTETVPVSPQTILATQSPYATLSADQNPALNNPISHARQNVSLAHNTT